MQHNEMLWVVWVENALQNKHCKTEWSIKYRNAFVFSTTVQQH